MDSTREWQEAGHHIVTVGGALRWTEVQLCLSCCVTGRVHTSPAVAVSGPAREESCPYVTLPSIPTHHMAREPVTALAKSGAMYNAHPAPILLHIRPTALWRICTRERNHANDFSSSPLPSVIISCSHSSARSYS